MILLVLFLLGLQGGHEILDLFPRLLGLFLVRLGFFDGADGVFDGPVGAFYDVFGFLRGLVEDVFLFLLDAFEFLLVSFGDAFQGLVGVADVLEFFVQRPAVLDDSAEVSFDAHKLLSDAGLRIFDDGLGQTHLPGQLKGEGIAGKSDVQLEQGFDLGGIEKHGAVDHPRFGSGCKEFEIRVMCGDDAVHAALVHLGQDGFGDGSARGGLRA